MAKVSFDTAVSSMKNDTNRASNGVGFLSLKNDGDEAIVRIMHDSVDDFDILTIHPVTVGGKFRTVNCIRDPRDPLGKCPLCESGVKVQSKIFIHMLQYVTDETGKIVAKPVVWERPISYATKLKNDLSEYGPLSNVIFKVKRNGVAGDKSTTYDMRMANPSMYNETSYPKTEGAFKDYSACGTIVMDKNYDELMSFVTTGDFNNGASKSTSSIPSDANVVEYDTPTPRESWAPSNGGYSPNGTSAPSRPTRYY